MEVNELIKRHSDMCLNCRCTLLESTVKVPSTLKLGSVTLAEMCNDLLVRPDETCGQKPSIPAKVYPSNMCQECSETIKSIYNFKQAFLSNHDRFTEEFLEANIRDNDPLATSLGSNCNVNGSNEDKQQEESLSPVTEEKKCVGKKNKPKPLEIPRINVISPFETVSQSGNIDNTRDAAAESTVPTFMSMYGNLPSSLLPFTLSSPTTPSKMLTPTFDPLQPLDLTKESLLTVESPFKILFSPLMSSMGHFTFNFSSPDHSFAVESQQDNGTVYTSVASGTSYTFGELINDPGGTNDSNTINSNDSNNNHNNNFNGDSPDTNDNNFCNYTQLLKTAVSVSSTPQTIITDQPVHIAQPLQNYYRQNVYTAPDVSYLNTHLGVVPRQASPIGSTIQVTEPNFTPIYTPLSRVQTINGSNYVSPHHYFVAPTLAVPSRPVPTVSAPSAAFLPSNNYRSKKVSSVTVEEEKNQLTKCPKCDRYFETRSLYLDHKLSVHSLDQMSCFMCGTLVLGLTHLADHIRTMHLDEREVSSNLNYAAMAIQPVSKFVGPKRKHVGYSVDGESRIKIQKLDHLASE